jgi:hypothetical protein
MEKKDPKDPTPPVPPSQTDARIKIYFLPNLMTAGNLFCGFMALTKIVEADLSQGNYKDIRVALLYILAACIFDLLDGRVARMGGHESPFGREFDSLADIISFGAARPFSCTGLCSRTCYRSIPRSAGSSPRFTSPRAPSASLASIAWRRRPAPRRQGIPRLSHSRRGRHGVLAHTVHDLVG